MAISARPTDRFDPKREVDDALLAVKKSKKRKYHQGTLPTPDLMAMSEHIGEGGHEEEIRGRVILSVVQLRKRIKKRIKRKSLCCKNKRLALPS